MEMNDTGRRPEKKLTFHEVKEAAVRRSWPSRTARTAFKLYCGLLRLMRGIEVECKVTQRDMEYAAVIADGATVWRAVEYLAAEDMLVEVRGTPDTYHHGVPVDGRATRMTLLSPEVWVPREANRIQPEGTFASSCRGSTSEANVIPSRESHPVPDRAGFGSFPRVAEPSDEPGPYPQHNISVDVQADYWIEGPGSVGPAGLLVVERIILGMLPDTLTSGLVADSLGMTQKGGRDVLRKFEVCGLARKQGRMTTVTIGLFHAAVGSKYKLDTINDEHRVDAFMRGFTPFERTFRFVAVTNAIREVLDVKATQVILSGVKTGDVDALRRAAEAAGVSIDLTEIDALIRVQREAAA